MDGELTLNPDERRSSSKIWTTEHADNANEVLMVIQCKKLGVITLHSIDGEFMGVGIFTVQDIGYAPDL